MYAIRSYYEIAARIAEHQLVGALVLPHHGHQLGVQLAGGHDDRQVIGIIGGTRHDPDRILDPRLLQGLRLGPDP